MAIALHSCYYIPYKYTCTHDIPYNIHIHTQVGEDRCAWVKPMVFANKAMATRDLMEQQAQAWIDEAGTVPPGNGVERELWEGASKEAPAAGVMTAAQRAAYEEKKLKLRKAMGENLADDVEGE